MRRFGNLRGRDRLGVVALLLLSVVLMPFARNLPLANAGSGPTLSALGTATVDGIISPGEYGSCISNILNYGGNVGYAFKFCETNDAVNLYLAFEVANTQNVVTDYLVVYFDNNHDGVIAPCSGGTTEDSVGLTGTVPGSFTDGNYCYSSSGNTIGSGDAAQQGVGVRKMGGLGSVYEFSHPLNSGDSNDFSLHFGDTVGWCLNYDSGYTGGGGFPNIPPNNCNSFVFSGDASTFGNIVIATPPHSTTYTDTGTTTSATSITSTSLTTGSTTTTQLLASGSTSTLTSTSSSTTTNTVNAMGVTSTTTTSTGELPVTETTTQTIMSTTTICPPYPPCTTLTFTNQTTSTIVTKSTETVTLTELVRTPVVFTDTETITTVVTSTSYATGEGTTTFTTTYTSSVLVTQTSASTTTYTTTITTIDTASSGGGGPPIPGFPVESILMGIILGAAVLMLLRSRRRA